MRRNLYSPRLSDDVVRPLYLEAQRLRIPMTRLADLLIREALAKIPSVASCPELARPAPHLRVVA